MSRDQLAADIWRACDIMRRDNNCGGVMEYVEHLSWVLFLKFLDEQENVFADEAALASRTHAPLLISPYRWSDWVPKALGRKTDSNGRRATPEWDGDRTMQFVRGELIPHLASLSGSSEREIIAGIFSERNVIVCASPYNLKDVLTVVDEIDFQKTDDIHTVSLVYEDLLRKMGQENQLAGEFYTPRAVIEFIVEVIDPQIGETVYDPACGSCGFPVEAFKHMLPQERTTRDNEILQRHTFVGHEKKPVPALLGLINLVLHGVAAPRIHRRNTLEEIDQSERYDVVLTNPPFGGTENAHLQQNFTTKANATELLFLQHIMRRLKRTGRARCGMVVPEGTLFRGGAFASVKKLLLHDFTLSFVVSLPPGVFAPYSDVKTALLFFQHPGPTQETLYYEMPMPLGLKKFSKGSPITREHLDGARDVWHAWRAYREGKTDQPEPTATSWIETGESLASRGFDLSARNPIQSLNADLPSATELVERLMENTCKYERSLERLYSLINQGLGTK